MADVTAIIPAYGRDELTHNAIRLLQRQSIPPREIVVVDDGSPQPFQSQEARVIRHERNRGFAAAVNTGIRETFTPWVLILNNDVSLEPSWLEKITGSLEPQIAFACGKLFRPDGLLDGTWDLLSRGGLAWRAGAGRPDGDLWSRLKQVQFTSFTAVVIKRELFESVGSLDESYESYYEDVQWSLRAALLGHCGIFQPEARGIHLGSATAGFRSYFAARQILRNHRRLALQFLLPAFKREYHVAHLLLRAHFLFHGQWTNIPTESIPPEDPAPFLTSLLLESELEIASLQQETGEDRLWKWYFRLSGTRPK